MSQSECVLSDGRKISDLKVLDLKKELEKFNKSKTGSKVDLVMRLTEAVNESRKENEDNKDTDDKVEEDNSRVVIATEEANVTENQAVNEEDGDSVDLDDVRNIHPEVNQSVDTLDIEAPVDETLNPEESNTEDVEVDIKPEEMTNETVESIDNEVQNEINNNTSSDRIVVCKEIEEESDKIELDTQDEMYEVYLDTQIINEDRKVEISREIVKQESNVETKKSEDIAMEEGEVLPITARLGKRIQIEKKGLKEVKGTGYKNEEPMRVQSPQKSKNIISEFLKIDNLVRPFTTGQLKDMLSTISGTESINEIWLNRIKSVAFVRYIDESTAISARERLDGCRWPGINPKLLSVDFSTEMEMDWMKKHGDSGSQATNTSNRIVIEERLTQDTLKRTKENNQAVENNQLLESDKIRNGKQKRTDNPKRSEKDARNHISDTKRRRSRSPVGRKRHESPLKEKKVETEKEIEKKPNAAKMLEDLFRKTVAQPCIYWLPVTKERREELKKLKENSIRV